MGELDLSGVKLFWTEKGSGVPVVFVHGIPTDYRAWSALTETWPEGLRAITYSRRYAYPNRREGDVRDSTIENNALDLESLIGQLGIRPVHLVGHSYGGFIAAFLAARRPESLRSLVLIEPALASLLLRDPNSRAQALALLFRHPRVAASASRYLRRYQRPASRALARGDLASAVRLNVDGVEDRSGAFENLTEPTRRMMLDNGRTVGETELPYPPLGRRDLERIRVPTLLINGARSALWLRSIGEMALRYLPTAKRSVVPGAGHYPHLEQPQGVRAQLLRFLAPPTEAG